MFEYRVNWYNDVIDQEEYVRGLVYGPSYKDAMEKVMKDYGEDSIIDVYLQALEDTDTIELVAIKKQFNL
jgi:hypothetical protein